MKNKTAQNGAPASCVTANGNTIKASPDPEDTTSCTGCSVIFDKYPMYANTTKPANIAVRPLLIVITSESLKKIFFN
jgi:hypothetical protein